MSNNIRNGVRVSGYIRPIGKTDSYATHLDIFGRGGIHSVLNQTDRDAITSERRSLGMFAYDSEGQTMYSLLGGVENSNWQKLFEFRDNAINFNGNLLADAGYIFLGNKDGVAKPSPSLIDIKYDIIDLRRDIDSLGTLEKLDHNRIWIGDYTNKPVARTNILVQNMPKMGAARFPVPLVDLPIAIPNPTFNHLSVSDRILSGPWLPEVFAGKADATDIATLNPSNPRTVVSSTLAMSQINAIQALKRLDHGNFIVSSKTVSWEWENHKMFLVPEAVKKLYNLNNSYRFTKAQALDELDAGLLKQSPVSEENPKGEGVLQRAIPGEDYVDVSNIDSGVISVLDENNKFIGRTKFAIDGGNTLRPLVDSEGNKAELNLLVHSVVAQGGGLSTNKFMIADELAGSREIKIYDYHNGGTGLPPRLTNGFVLTGTYNIGTSSVYYVMPTKYGKEGEVLTDIGAVTDPSGQGRNTRQLEFKSTAPHDATYILQKPSDKLNNSQALSEAKNSLGVISHGILKTSSQNGVISIASGGKLPTNDYVRPLDLIQEINTTRAFATAEATAAELAANAYFLGEMLPFIPVPPITIGGAISAAIGAVEAQVLTKESKTDHDADIAAVNAKIDNLDITLEGEAYGSGKLNQSIDTKVGFSFFSKSNLPTNPHLGMLLFVEA